MDINQLLPILASRPPAQRVQLAAQLGLNAQALQQLETIAERGGLPLNGGRSVAAEGGADGGDFEGEGDESGAPTEGTLTLSTVRLLGGLGGPFPSYFFLEECRWKKWITPQQITSFIPLPKNSSYLNTHPLSFSCLRK